MNLIELLSNDMFLYGLGAGAILTYTFLKYRNSPIAIQLFTSRKSKQVAMAIAGSLALYIDGAIGSNELLIAVVGSLLGLSGLQAWEDNEKRKNGITPAPPNPKDKFPNA